ncbi:hypothetical protein AN1V17_26620 [Vallitalea sediminicola]
MKKLKIYDKYFRMDNRIIEVERLVKTSSSIIGITGSREIFRFNDINNFSIFSLDKGVKWDISDEDTKNLQKEEIIKELAEEKLRNIQKNNVISEITKELASVKLDIIKIKGSEV